MKHPKISSDENKSLQYSAFTHFEIIFLLILSIVAVIVLDLIFYSKTLEDAYITFRYSKHLAEGFGFGAWNRSGERVEGYSSFLWMLLLGIAEYFGFDVQVTSKILGILSHLVLSSSLIIFPLLQRRESNNCHDLLANSNETVLAGLFLSLYLPIAYYSTTGMETVFFVALVVLFIISMNLSKNIILLSIITVLLILTRPEGLIIVGPGLLFMFIKEKTNKRPLLHLYGATVSLLVTFGILSLYRLILFHDIVPNTYWAKVSGGFLMHVRWGMHYLFDWLKSHKFIFYLSLASVALFFSSIRDWIRDWPVNMIYTISLLIAFSIYIVRIGGDNYSAFPLWRHFVHIIPLIALLFCYAITRILHKYRYSQLLVLAFIIMVTNQSLLYVNVNGESLRSLVSKSLLNYPRLTLDPPNQYYLWLKNISDSDTTIASSLGGELPYTVDAIHIDILGLNTRYIAKHGTFDPYGPQDSKTDMEWVMEQRPDIIEGYISAKKIIQGIPLDVMLSPWRYQMNFGLISSPIFQHEYCFIRNGPYSYIDRALFFKISYCMTHPLKNKLDCVPIAQTTLGEILLRAYPKTPAARKVIQAQAK